MSLLSLENTINKISNSRRQVKNTININDLKKSLQKKTTKNKHNKTPTSNFVDFKKMINSIFHSKKDPIKAKNNLNSSQKNIRPANKSLNNGKDINFLFEYNNRKLNENEGNLNKKSYHRLNKDRSIEFIKKVNSYSKDLKKNFSINNFINNRPAINIKDQNIQNELCNNIKYVHNKCLSYWSPQTKSLRNFEIPNEKKYMILKDYYSKYPKNTRNKNFFTKSSSNLNINYNSSNTLTNTIYMKENNDNIDIVNYKNSFNIKQPKIFLK
jgi:hypothetical protein